METLSFFSLLLRVRRKLLVSEYTRHQILASFLLPPLDPPVRITYPSESEVELTHLASDRLELRCEISQADAAVRWYKDSLEVEEGPNLILDVEGTCRRLVIPVTTVDDTGEYVCDTEDDSVAFLVTVKGKNRDYSF